MCNCVANVKSQIRTISRRGAPMHYEELGSGAFKRVFQTCSNHVLKICFNDPNDPNHLNNEWRIWRYSNAAERRMLAPVVAYGKTTKLHWMIQRFCLPVNEGKKKYSYKELEKIFHSFDLDDVQAANCGWYKDRIVLIDYGC